MTVETWKTIPRFGGHYSASNRGNIRRDTSGNGTFIGRVLAQKLGARGYYMVAPSVIGVKQRSFVVHRLVLEAFAGDPVGDRKYANHINGIKTDNRIDNLEWVTWAENISHAYRTGLHGRYAGSASSAAKLNESQVSEILRLIAARAYRKDIAAQFGISTKAIDEIVSGAHWKHVARTADMTSKRMGRHVLTADDVRAIRAMLGTMSHAKIGALFGVSGPTIWQIASGRTWADVGHHDSASVQTQSPPV